MRSTLLDARVQPVFNDALNPSPQLASLGYRSPGFGTGGAGSTGRVAGAGVDGDFGYQQTWTATPTAGNGNLLFGRNTDDDIPVRPGQLVPFSSFGKANRDALLSGRVYFYNSLQAQISFVQTPAIACFANAYNRFIVPTLVPLTAVRASFGLVAEDLSTQSWVGTLTNVHPNPFFIAGGSNGVTQTNTTVSLDTFMGRSMLKSVCNSASAVGTRLLPNNKRIGAVLGDVVYMRATIWNDSPAPRNYQASIRSSSGLPTDSGYAQLTVYAPLGNITIPAGGSFTFDFSVLITDDSAQSALPVIVRQAQIGAAIGDIFWAETVWFSKQPLPAAVSVFDGNTVETGRLHAFTGVVAQSPSTRSGDSLAIDHISTAPGLYRDGSFPGWKWLGSEYASRSVGYPVLA